MDFIEFTVSLGSGIIIMLIGIIAYLVKKDFARIEKKLTEKRSKEACEMIHKATDEQIIRKIGELDVKITKDFLARLEPDLGIKNSPSQPSEIGQKLLKDSGWNKIYKEMKQEIFDWIDKEDPQTLYDTEEAAFYVLYSNKDNKRFNKLKDFVMNSPDEVSLESIFLVASWIIRDKYWEEKISKKHE